MRDWRRPVDFLRALSFGAVLASAAPTARAEPQIAVPAEAPEMIEVAAFFERLAPVCTALAAAQGYTPHPIGLYDGPGLGFERRPDRVVAHRALSLRGDDGRRRTLYCHHDFLRDVTVVTPEPDPPLPRFAQHPRVPGRVPPVLFLQQALADWALSACRAQLEAAGLREVARRSARARWDDPRAVTVTLQVRDGFFGRIARRCAVDPLAGSARLLPEAADASPAD